jgi:hypothetical protein
VLRLCSHIARSEFRFGDGSFYHAPEGVWYDIRPLPLFLLRANDLFRCSRIDLRATTEDIDATITNFSTYLLQTMFSEGYVLTSATTNKTAYALCYLAQLCFCLASSLLTLAFLCRYLGAQRTTHYLW